MKHLGGRPLGPRTAKHVQQILHETNEIKHGPEDLERVRAMIRDLRAHHKITPRNEEFVLRSARKSTIGMVKLLAESEHVTPRNIVKALGAVDRETRSRARWFQEEGLKVERTQRRWVRTEHMKHMIRIANAPNAGGGNYKLALTATKYLPLFVISEMARDPKLGRDGFREEMRKALKEGHAGKEIHYHRVKGRVVIDR